MVRLLEPAEIGFDQRQVRVSEPVDGIRLEATSFQFSGFGGDKPFEATRG